LSGEERNFKLISDFVVDGIEYDGGYGKRHIDYLVKEVIKKFAPKSKVKHFYVSFDLNERANEYDLVRCGENLHEER